MLRGTAGTARSAGGASSARCSVAYRVALRHVATCCTALQHVAAVSQRDALTLGHSMLNWVAVLALCCMHSAVWQAVCCIARLCDVFQHVATCCAVYTPSALPTRLYPVHSTALPTVRVQGHIPVVRTILTHDATTLYGRNRAGRDVAVRRATCHVAIQWTVGHATWQYHGRWNVSRGNTTGGGT